MKNFKLLKFVALLMLVLMGCFVLISCNRETTEQPSELPGSSTTEASSTNTTASRTTQTSSTKPKITLPEYDNTSLIKYARTPIRLDGSVFSEIYVDLGQGSFMHLKNNVTSADSYEKYLQELEELGFTLYTDNKIGDNLFATYITQTQIVNVMYLKAFEQIRVIEDDRAEFDLPGLKEDNVYEDLGENLLTLVADDYVVWPGRMGYIYKLADGSFVIIDGGATKWVDGCGSSADLIMNVLKKHADNPNDIRIAAWLITHIHEDHMGGFYDMSLSSKYTDKITIERLIYNQPSETDAQAQDVGAYTHATLTEVCELMETAIDNWKPVHVIKAHPGQVFYLRNMTMTVYYSQELLMCTVNNITSHNNVSIVTKVDFMDNTALYLGDTLYDANQRVIAPLYGEALKSDIVQTAHHGYGDGGCQQIYEYAQPSVVFWPVYAYHYYTSDTYGGVKDIDMNQVLFKDGIKHFIHDKKCITFSDFETWEGKEWDALP